MNPTDTIGITDFLVLVYKFLKRNLLLIGAITMVGFAIGLAYSYQKASYYSSELVGFTDIVDQTTLLEILGPLTTLTDEKNHAELANKLGISVEQAAQIRALEFASSRHTKTSHAPQATDKKLGELIVVKSTVYDQSVFLDLEKGITHYLAENNFIQTTKNLELAKTQHLISEITTNLNMLDSLFRSSSDKKVSAMVSITKELNPVNYNEALLNLEDLKIRSQIIQPFTVVSSFYKVNKPSNKSLLIVTAATVAFFILSLLIVFVRELHQLASR